MLPGSNAPSTPGGDSAGTLRIDRRGTLTFTGHLADGAPVVQKAPLLSSKRWPLYAPLYGGAGSTLGWIEFAERETDDLHGVVVWSKPPLSGEQFYPAGFVLHSEATGSRYRPPSGRTNLLVSFTNGDLSFSRGDLVDPFINSIVLTARRQVVNLSSNRLTMTFMTDRGLFRGSVTTPGDDRVLPFTGVLHQKADLGTGFFLGTNLSGLVQLNAAANP